MAKRLVIAGTGSSSGKTTLMLGLMALLKDRDLASFKIGPDFVDPLFHREVLGISSRNLDGFFCSDTQLREHFARHAKSYNLIEGVMGYYDGQALEDTRSSSYDIARILQVPTLLVVNLAGMGHSVCALIRGFVEYKPESQIRGVFLNQCSQPLYERLAPVIEAECGVPAVGYLAKAEELSIGSRELGLQPEERVRIEHKLENLVERLRGSLDLDQVLAWMEDASAIEVPAPLEKPVPDIRIGVARDEAFCFYYPENLELLEQLGAEIIEFSPIHDNGLPAVSGLYLGGGYPEDYAKALSQNQSMLEALRQTTLPIMAEAGGYFYLTEALEGRDGRIYPMVGRLPGQVLRSNRLGRFGYQRIIPPSESLLGEQPILGHEFHYWDHDTPGCDLTIQKNERQWRDGYASRNLYASNQYLYLPSQPQAAEAFLAAARRTYETP